LRIPHGLLMTQNPIYYSWTKSNLIEGGDTSNFAFEITVSPQHQDGTLQLTAHLALDLDGESEASNNVQVILINYTH